MTKDEALKIALQALKTIDEAMPFPVAKLAQAAIKEALAQPEQKPVAWVSTTELLVMRGNALGGAKDWRINLGFVKQDGDVGLYTTPPQRKPLTDEEIRKANHHMVDGAYDYSFKQGVKWAEYKHGIEGEA